MFQIILKIQEIWLVVLIVSLSAIETLGLTGCGKAMNTSGGSVKKQAFVKASGIQIQVLPIKELPLDLIEGRILLTTGFTVLREQYQNVTDEPVRLWVNAPVSPLNLESKLDTLMSGKTHLFRNYRAPIACNEVDFSKNFQILKKVFSDQPDFYELKPGESIELNWIAHAPLRRTMCEFIKSDHIIGPGIDLTYDSNWQAVSIDGKVSAELRVSNTDLQSFSIDQSTRLLSKSEELHESVGNWQAQPGEDFAGCQGLQIDDGSMKI